MRKERLKKLQPPYFGKKEKKKGDQDDASKKGDQDDAAKKAAEEAAKKAAEEEAAKKGRSSQNKR